MLSHQCKCNWAMEILTAAAGILLIVVVPSTARTAGICFDPISSYPTGDYPNDVVTTDVDLDGDLDIVVNLLHPSQLVVLRNDGLGGFGPPTSYPAGSFTTGMTTGDLNGDGYPDLLAANQYSNNLSVLLNNGDGTFGPTVQYAAGSGAHEVSVVDLDRDGDLDAVVPNLWSHDFTVFRNNGSGVFTYWATYPASTNPFSASSGDLDGINGSDVVITNVTAGSVSVLLNDGTGVLTPAAAYGVGTHPTMSWIGDLDGDGDLDVAVPNALSHNISVLINNGSGVLAPKIDYPGGNGPNGISGADLDGDGDFDLAIANQSVSVLVNDGNGGFATKLDFEVGVGEFTGAVAPADLNSDGCLDLAVANASGDCATVMLGTCTACTQETSCEGSDSKWEALGSGIDSRLTCLGEYDGKLIAGGIFNSAGGVPGTHGIAAWDGTAWSSLGGGLGGAFWGEAIAMTVWNGKLIVGGDFTLAGGVSAREIAAWDGSSWSALGTGMTGNGDMLTNVYGLTVFDGRLIACGSFLAAGGVTVNYIAAWDGGSWSALGTGMNGPVGSLAIYDGRLVAGGSFTVAGGVAANNVAAWDGSTWSPLGEGVNNASGNMTLYQGRLVVCGPFTASGGTALNHIAFWDGTSWSPIGSGFNGTVSAVTVRCGQLVAAGYFTQSGGTTVNRVASWDGSSWSPFGSGVNNEVWAATVYQGNLVLGGWITTAGSTPVNRIAQWICTCPVDVDQIPPVVVCPPDISEACASSAGAVVTYEVAVSDDRDVSPAVSCNPPSGSVFPIGTTPVRCIATDAAGNRDSCEFMITVNEGLGSVTGRVLADCEGQQSELHGVRIDAYDNTGHLALSTETDPSGTYALDGLPSGQSYTITVITPLGYYTAEDERLAQVHCSEVIVVDFDFSCIPATHEPRTIGFWKHQVGVATGGNGRAQVDGPTLCGYLGLIQDHFNSNAINPVVVYVPPASDACVDKLNVAKILLNLKGNAGMTARAKQQLTALLLNVAAGYISLRTQVSSDGATLSQAITHCDLLIDDASGDHERAKSICDLINNNIAVPSGWIPIGTADIAYKASSGVPRSFTLDQNYPNPFNSGTVISYTLNEDSPVRLEVFDILGRNLVTLVDQMQPVGQHQVVWDGRNEDGEPAASGMYFYRLRVEGFAESKKMILVK